MVKKIVNTEFVDAQGRRIKKLVGGKHFVYKMVNGKRVKVQGNKAAKRADGRNIANMMSVPPALRNKNMSK
jgi:hypothetical protein